MNHYFLLCEQSEGMNFPISKTKNSELCLAVKEAQENTEILPRAFMYAIVEYIVIDGEKHSIAEYHLNGELIWECDEEYLLNERKKILSSKEPSMTDIMFNPEKFGYAECSHCNGYGSSLKETEEKCTNCNGTGVVKEKEVA